MAPTNDTDTTISPIRVLVVDDSAADVEAVGDLLPSTHFHVAVAGSASEAGRLLDSRPFDVVLLDLGLPDSAGMDTLRAVLPHAARLPILILTAQEDEDLLHLILREGAQDYLIKRELTGPSLHRAIRYALDRHPLLVRLQESVAALEQSRTQLRQVVEHNVDAMLVLDEEDTICFANPAAEALFGQPSGGLVGTPFGRPSSAGEMGEIEVRQPDGRIVTVEMRAGPIEWDGRPALLASLRDVTLRKRQEEDLRRHTEELAAANTDLERFNELAVGRELRMIELKREVNELCRRLGEEPRYDVSFAAGLSGEGAEDATGR